MADTYTRDHVDAFLARLRADPLLADIVLDVTDGESMPDGSNPTPRPPKYLMVYSDDGMPRYGRLSGPVPDRLLFTFHVHAVGEDRYQAQALMAHTLTAMQGWRPSVDGWQPGYVKHTASYPYTTDKNFVPHIVYGICVFTLTTSRG